MENEVDKCLDNFLLIDEESKLFKRIKKENKDFNEFLLSNEISFKILLLVNILMSYIYISLRIFIYSSTLIKIKIYLLTL